MASLRIIWIIWMSDHSAVLCGATFIGHKVHGCDPDRMPHTRTNIGNSETKAIDATTKSSSADSKVNGGAVDRRTERERERERKATKNEPSIAHRKTREEKKIQDGRPTKAKREREREREREPSCEFQGETMPRASPDDRQPPPLHLTDATRSEILRIGSNNRRPTHFLRFFYS